VLRLQSDSGKRGWSVARAPDTGLPNMSLIIQSRCAQEVFRLCVRRRGCVEGVVGDRWVENSGKNRGCYGENGAYFAWFQGCVGDVVCLCSCFWLLRRAFPRSRPLALFLSAREKALSSVRGKKEEGKKLFLELHYPLCRFPKVHFSLSFT